MGKADRQDKGPKTLFTMGAGSDDGDPGETADQPGDTGPVEGEGEEFAYFCGECGAELPDGAVFCGECGTPVALGDDALDGLLLEEDSLGAEDADTSITGEDGSDVPVDEPVGSLYQGTDSVEPVPVGRSESFEMATPVVGSLDEEVLSEESPVEETVQSGDLSAPASGEDRAPASETPPTPATPATAVTAASPVVPSPVAAPAPALKDGSQGGKKTGLLVAAAIVVVVLIGGGIALAMSGSKSSKNDEQTVAGPASSSTTTTAQDQPGEPGSGDSDRSTTTTTAPEQTTITALETTTTTSQVTTTVTQTVPVGPAPSPVPVPTTAPAPAYINVSPGSGNIRIPKKGSFNIELFNSGGSAGQYQIRANGLTVSGPTSGSLPAGASLTLPVSDTNGMGRTVTVAVAAAGSGTVNYTVVIDS